MSLFLGGILSSWPKLREETDGRARPTGAPGCRTRRTRPPPPTPWDGEWRQGGGTTLDEAPAGWPPARTEDKWEGKRVSALYYGRQSEKEERRERRRREK